MAYGLPEWERKERYLHMMTNQMTPMTPFLRHMPNQNVGGRWYLAGSLKQAEIGIPPFPLNQVSQGAGELILVRRMDALSPHISFTQTNQFMIPEMTVTIPSGQQVTFHNVRVRKQGNTYEWEEIRFTYQTIDVTWNDGNKNGVDDWRNG